MGKSFIPSPSFVLPLPEGGGGNERYLPLLAPPPPKFSRSENFGEGRNFCFLPSPIF